MYRACNAVVAGWTPGQGVTASDINKTKFLNQEQDQNDNTKTKTKTTGSKQKHFADLTFK